MDPVYLILFYRWKGFSNTSNVYRVVITNLFLEKEYLIQYKQEHLIKQYYRFLCYVYKNKDTTKQKLEWKY